MRSPVSVSYIAVMPTLVARAPVRRGRVSDLSFRSYAARGEESRLASLFHRFTLNGSTDLIPKERVCCVVTALDELCRHVRGRRKDGGRGIATKTLVLGGIFVCACDIGSWMTSERTQAMAE